MTQSHEFSSIDPTLLAELCSQETKKYFRKIAYQAGYCFELLCRACRDSNEDALSHVFRLYWPILAARARRHPLFPHSSFDAETMARTALSSFYLAVKGEKFLQKFSTLAQVIAYLHACVHTAVLEDIRYTSASESSQEDDIPAATPHSSAELQDFWAHICTVIPDKDDQHLAYLRFVLEMKPAEIMEQDPQRWSTPRSVSVDLQNIRRHLRADKYLRGLVGLDENVDDDSDDASAPDLENNTEN